MRFTWTYTIDDLHETFSATADDLAELVEARSAILTMASRRAHNEACKCHDAQFIGQDMPLRCDSCDTWVATHEVTVGLHTYHVCDKPRCQDYIQALREAEQGPAETDTWEKEFAVVRLTRQDVHDAGFSDTQIAGITDEEMQRIASRLEDSLRGDNWEELVEIQTSMVLDR